VLLTLTDLNLARKCTAGIEKSEIWLGGSQSNRAETDALQSLDQTDSEAPLFL
jgi:hypothetical protein